MKFCSCKFSFSAQNVRLAAKTIALPAGKTKQNNNSNKTPRTIPFAAGKGENYTFCSWKRRELYLLQLEKERTIPFAAGKGENYTFCSWKRRELYLLQLEKARTIPFAAGKGENYTYCDWRKRESFLQGSGEIVLAASDLPPVFEAINTPSCTDQKNRLEGLTSQAVLAAQIWDPV